MVREMEIQDPCAFLESLAHNQPVGQRIPQTRWQMMTFADFINDLIGPYILEEISRQMQDAQSLLLNVTEEHLRAFETEIVENANCWMEYQRKNFRQLAMSDRMIRKRVEAVEQAAANGYGIDAENEVVMNAAPALPLVIESPSQYADEVAACMINQTYQSWLNKVGRQFSIQQEQLAELQKEMPKTQERRTPFEVAFSELIRSRETTPLVKNLQQLLCSLGVTKSCSISQERSLRHYSPQPSPPETVSAIPSPLSRSSTIPALPAVEQSTPAIYIERERPFAAAGQTPVPIAPQIPGVFASAVALLLRQSLWAVLDLQVLPQGQRCQHLLVFVLLT